MCFQFVCCLVICFLRGCSKQLQCCTKKPHFIGAAVAEPPMFDALNMI